MLVALGCSNRAQAQSQMVITKNDGTQVKVRVADIKDVTFPDDAQLTVTMCYDNFWLKPGQWVQLAAECTNAMGKVEKTDIFWKSSNNRVATVDSDGKVTAVADGTCQIMAMTESGQGEMTIQVTSEKMLDINVDQIGNQWVSYTITPSDPSLRYYSLLRIQSGEYSVDRMDQYGSEEQNCFHFALDWWDFCAGLYGMSWIDFMNEVGLEQGTTRGYESELKPGEQYCLFAFAMNQDGTLASPIELQKFTTTKPEASDITFEVTVDEINSAEVRFTIVPSNNDKYFVNVQRASYVEWFVENDKVESEMVPSLTSNFLPDVYPESYCQGTVTRSTDDFLSSIRRDNDYYIIVFGYDEGLTSSGVTLVKFHTLP